MTVSLNELREQIPSVEECEIEINVAQDVLDDPDAYDLAAVLDAQEHKARWERLLAYAQAADALVARVEQAERERDSLMADTWRAFVVAGGDPDGNLKWHCDPSMAGRTFVDCVEQLRSDYNEAGDEVRAAVARADRLEKALRRATYIASHLHGACGDVEWTGVIGPNGEREDDYLNELIASEIRELAALAQDATPTEEEPVDRSPDAQLWPATAPLESAWVLIANAYDGNWEQAPVEWREAAEKWRDEVWHKSLATPTEEATT